MVLLVTYGEGSLHTMTASKQRHPFYTPPPKPQVSPPADSCHKGPSQTILRVPRLFLVLSLGYAEQLSFLFFSFFFIDLSTSLFNYFWLCWIFFAVFRLSLVVASKCFSLLRCTDFSWWLLLLCSRYMGSPPWQVESSWIRDRTRVPCLSRWILNHWTTTRKFQFSSVAQLCPTLCDPMDCSMPGLPVHHQLPEFAQTHVH